MTAYTKAFLVIVAFQTVAIHAQASDPAGTAAPPQSADVTYTPDTTLQFGTVDDLIAACQKESGRKPAYAYCRDFVNMLVKPDPARSRVRRLVNIGTDTAQLAQAFTNYQISAELESAKEQALKVADQNVLEAAANIAQKKQIGSPAAANGSTALVSKSLITNLLQIAAESGALTQTQSGNTITLQANADHLFRQAFNLDPQLSYLPKGTPYLENLTAAVGLAVNANSTVTASTTGSATSTPIDVASVLADTGATKISSVTVNYEFNDKLTTGYLQKYLKKTGKKHLFVDADPTTAPAVYRAQGALIEDLANSSVCQMDTYTGLAQKYSDQWKASHGTNPAPAEPDLFEPFISTFGNCFEKGVEAAGPNFKADWENYVKALQADIASFQKSLREQISGWDGSFQYVYNKPVSQPATHDFRFVMNGDMTKGAASTWNANGDVTIYESIPAGANYGRLKDVQMAAEFDNTFGSSKSAPTFSLAGYGQYQPKPSVLNITASSVPSGITLPADAQVFLTGTEGWIGVVQAKYTVHLGSAQIPLGVKWSNKTNLLDKSKLGAQFGISYDLSQLKQIVGRGTNPGN